MFFCFSLFVLQNTYLTHSVQGQLCGFHNEMPRKFLHAFGELLIYYWALSDKSVQLQSNKSFLQSPTFVVVQFCRVSATQNVNSYMRRLCTGYFLSCLRYSPKLFFLSAPTAVKRNTAQRENCSLTAVSSLKVFAVIAHIRNSLCMTSDNARSGFLDSKCTYAVL